MTDRANGATATSSPSGLFAPLTESPRLRLATVFIFYIFQGAMNGTFYFALPAFLAVRGASALEIGAVVSAYSLPTSLKLFNGFLMDRYTFLPMGRRRVWLIGAQTVMVLGLLTVALVAPGVQDIALLSLLAFTINLATTFQDVAIDSLVVDIMEGQDRERVGSLMMGAQILGAAGATAIEGYLLESFGLRATFLGVALLIATGVAFAIMLRERPGERRLPWSPGAAHPRNIAIRINAWRLLLKKGFAALVAPASLLLVPFLLLRNISGGVNDVFSPILSADYVGWTTSQFTAMASLVQLGLGLFGLAFGGKIIVRLGPRPVVVACFALFALEYCVAALLFAHWTDPLVLTAIVLTSELFGLLLVIALIALVIRICSPAVAATQFAIYMAIANFGRPIGAWIAGLMAESAPQLMYFVVAALMAVTALGAAALFSRFSGEEPGSTPPVGQSMPIGN